MKSENTKATYHKICCPCGAKIMSKSPLSNEMIVGDWEKIGKQWYCDECVPYRRKVA